MTRVDDSPGLVDWVQSVLASDGDLLSEVLGLEVSDVSFDRKTVRFRPDEYRHLKTRSSDRSVPLWPQLEEILRDYVYAETAPREGYSSRRRGRVGW